MRKKVFNNDKTLGAQKLRRLTKDGVFSLDQSTTLCDAGICGKRFGAKLAVGLAAVYIGSARSYPYLEHMIFDKSQLDPIIKTVLMEMIYGSVYAVGGLVITNKRLSSVGGLRIGDIKTEILDKGNSILRVGGTFVGTHIAAKIESFLNTYGDKDFYSLIGEGFLQMQDAPVALLIILYMLKSNVRKSDRAGTESVADPDIRDLS